MADRPQDTPLSVEATQIRNALQLAQRDKSLAARLLGINEMELLRRIQLHGLTLEGLSEE